MPPSYESPLRFQEGWSSLQTHSRTPRNPPRGLTLQMGMLGNLKARTALRMCSKNLQLAPNCGTWVSRGIPYRDIMRSDWGRGELMGLDISIREAGHVRIVDLQGRLIIGAEADRLQTELRRLIENGYRQIVVNLSCVEQIDSTGISTLVRNCTGLVRAGGSLKLVCPAGRVRAALEVTRLVSAIPTFNDEPQALASLRPAGPLSFS